MDTIKRTVIYPGISQEELIMVWESAIQGAKRKPGTPIAVVFMPGNYPLPEPGLRIYKEIPTLLHAAAPGTEVEFVYWAAADELTVHTFKNGRR